jgi:hypothetical protein
METGKKPVAQPVVIGPSKTAGEFTPASKTLTGRRFALEGGLHPLQRCFLIYNAGQDQNQPQWFRFLGLSAAHGAKPSRLCRST